MLVHDQAGVGRRVNGVDTQHAAADVAVALDRLFESEDDDVVDAGRLLEHPDAACDLMGPGAQHVLLGEHEQVLVDAADDQRLQRPLRVTQAFQRRPAGCGREEGAQCFRGRFPAGVRELIVDGLQGGGGDRDGGLVAAEIAGKGRYGRNRAGHRRDDVARAPIEGQPLAGFHGLPDFQGRRRPAPGRAGVQECDRCSGRDNLRPRESGRQGGVTQAGLAKAKECFHLTIHPSEKDGKKSPPPRGASEHHVALGALHRARPVFRVAADALLVQGVGALGHVRVALLRIVALRAGCGLVVLVLG